MWGKSKSFRLLISLEELSEVPLFFLQSHAIYKRRDRLKRYLGSYNQ